MVAWALCLAGFAASGVGAQSPEPVTMVLHWQHQAQFAGYYMALAKGLYRQQGLDMQILRGGPDVRVGEMLRSGKADFATFMLSSALETRAQGLPLVHLAQVVNRSNFLLVAWRHLPDGGSVRELSDLNGRKVTVWLEDFRAPYLAMFAAHNVNPIVLPQYSSFSLFLHRGAAAFAGMRYNEYHTMLQSGVAEDEVQVFPLWDHGVRLPEDGLYCLAENWQRRPRTCRAFALASLDGWRYAREHTEETLDVVMGYVERDHLPTNRMHMRWMLKEMIASVFPGPSDGWTLGELSRPAYEKALAALTQKGQSLVAPPYDDFVVGGKPNGPL
jgi:NitT/TauT family transport system substrate-binding protein